MKTELQIIKKYCGQIEERIKACKNRNIAEMLMKQLCTELDQNCKSEIVMNFLQVHVVNLINNAFDEKGNNKYMEKL